MARAELCQPKRRNDSQLAATGFIFRRTQCRARKNGDRRASRADDFAEVELIQFAYFINGGCASILNVMSDGKCVEVGLVGKEGFVGSPLLAGFRTSPTRVIIQVAGSGFRIGADDLHTALDEFPRLLASLERYTQELNIQAMQTAACNRLHEVEHRLARWLLMTQDRAGSIRSS